MEVSLFAVVFTACDCLMLDSLMFSLRFVNFSTGDRPSVLSGVAQRFSNAKYGSSSALCAFLNNVCEQCFKLLTALSAMPLAFGYLGLAGSFCSYLSHKKETSG